MRKLMGMLVLGTGLAVLSVGALSPADAQVKDGKKGAGKVAEVKPGTVEIYKAKDGGYRYRVKDADGKVIAMPPRSFDSAEEVSAVLDAVKNTLTKAKPKIEGGKD